MSVPHQFHIPVMGTAFTIDTPIKVARFGISSVISIGDDELCETMREHYAKEYGLPFEPIKKWSEDYRARRITGYLDLVQHIVDSQIETLKQDTFEPGTELTRYFEMLHESSPLKQAYTNMQSLPEGAEKEAAQNELRSQIKAGDIEVNIMTKVDRLNYTRDGELLPEKFADALSGLRGFAQSKLESSIVFSAGFNRRLYAYISEFEDFFPDAMGNIKKKICLKVSDFRSSLTQGKFLAKKGLWISEHRIESGLNCGGHAFATDGFLMGPILEEFKQKKDEFFENMRSICNESLKKLNRSLLPATQDADITVQGGIGTANEQAFLMAHYDVARTGWASPFLLVPEVTQLDEPTRRLVAGAPKKDFYLSRISPLGIPFNSVRGTESDKQRQERIEENKPGSSCPKGFLVSNTEFTKVPICTASKTYQRFKLKQIDTDETMDDTQKETAREKALLKTCLCEDLAAAALINNDISNKRSLRTAVCAGPNTAYFSKISTLSEMIDHIYGRTNLLNDVPRPHMFINELKMYIDYFVKDVKDALPTLTDKNIAYFNDFKNNLFQGIEYYKNLIPEVVTETSKFQEKMKEDLLALSQELEAFVSQNSFLSQEPQPLNA